MKQTTLDNPDITVRDSRILELDDIVQEVRESEEWEAVKMNILEVGIKNGEFLKLLSQIRKKIARGLSSAQIADALEEPEERIVHIMELIEEHPDWTDDQLLQALK